MGRHEDAAHGHLREIRHHWVGADRGEPPKDGSRRQKAECPAVRPDTITRLGLTSPVAHRFVGVGRRRELPRQTA